MQLEQHQRETSPNGRGPTTEEAKLLATTRLPKAVICAIHIITWSTITRLATTTNAQALRRRFPRAGHLRRMKPSTSGHIQMSQRIHVPTLHHTYVTRCQIALLLKHRLSHFK